SEICFEGSKTCYEASGTEVEQLRSRWSMLDPRMSPLSSLGIVTDALLSQDTLPVVENMDGYRDQDMGDIIFREPFYKALCVEAKRFDGLITIHNALAEQIIVAGAKNHPSMLEKSMYYSWTSRIRLFIKGKKHVRMMLDSIDDGPLVYPTVKESGQTSLKKYSELTEE
nr:ribonuclease H-like domain-containing protein [Tanacetum cinerariifolium]